MEDSVTDQRVLWPDGSTSLPPIDLVNDEPQIRIERLAPGLSRTIGPWQPVRIGHLVELHGPIYTDGKVIAPEDAGFLYGDCRACDSELLVLPHQERGVTWFVIHHRPDCWAFAAMRAGELALDEP